MVRFQIRVNHGDNDKTVLYYFTHKDYEKISEEAQNEAFDKAVKELNRIYKEYGRFATQTGVTNLFKSFGFERSLP